MIGQSGAGFVGWEIEMTSGFSRTEAISWDVFEAIRGSFYPRELNVVHGEKYQAPRSAAKFRWFSAEDRVCTEIQRVILVHELI